jgi:hypothetical protein
MTLACRFFSATTAPSKERYFRATLRPSSSIETEISMDPAPK